MMGNWIIFIAMAFLIGVGIYAIQWNDFLAAGLLISALLLISLTFYFKKKIRENRIKDSLPETRYSYSAK
ncbi:hypothetical protein HYV50_03405 [Candidatus Pacearchaeota archaeon]|nr:hypothetical protein [Candidatus Pacearchaeota archaeon]